MAAPVAMLKDRLEGRLCIDCLSSVRLVRGELSWGRWSANIPALAPQLLEDAQDEKLYNFCAARDKSDSKETKVSPCSSLKLEKMESSYWHSRGAKGHYLLGNVIAGVLSTHFISTLKYDISLCRKKSWINPHLDPYCLFVPQMGVRHGSSPQRSQATCLMWAWLLRETSCIPRSSDVPFRPHSPSVNTKKKRLDSLLGIIYVMLKDSHSLHKPHKWPQKK